MSFQTQTSSLSDNIGQRRLKFSRVFDALYLHRFQIKTINVKIGLKYISTEIKLILYNY